MNLEMLKAKRLSKETLKKINAGFAPDCEPGETRIGPGGLIWVCNMYCAWEIPLEPI